MTRPLRYLLLALALLFSQHAAMLHGVAHAKHELAVAQSEAGKAPVLDHGIDVCAAFGALAHALGSFVGAACAASAGFAATAVFSPTLTLPARIVFDSRAPPCLNA